MSVTARTSMLLTFVSLAAGCQRGDRLAAANGSTGTATAADTAARVVVEAPGALATRTEARESFDRARAAFVQKDYRVSARYVATAAAFLRSHAAAAETGAIAALQGSAKELEVMAERLRKGEPQTLRALDRVFANAQRAEAQHHLTRALAALADRSYRAAGEELLIAVDHLERAASDLRRPNDSETSAVLSDARALAERLVRGQVPARAETRRVTKGLESELRRVCRIIDLEARACAVEAEQQPR